MTSKLPSFFIASIAAANLGELLLQPPLLLLDALAGLRVTHGGQHAPLATDGGGRERDFDPEE